MTSLEAGSVDESSGGYSMFRARAQHPNAETDATWRIGFAPEYRANLEARLASSILGLLDSSSGVPPESPVYLVDIGAGASPLTDLLTTACRERSWIHVVVDAPEMLAHLISMDSRVKIVGQFPSNVAAIEQVSVGHRIVLAYSVLQYAFRDGVADRFVDGVLNLMTEGGVALLGDIPNRDMRDRQLRLDQDYLPERKPDDIRDQDLLAWVAKSRKAGFNAFVTPHFDWDPMRLYREHLLIEAPKKGRSQ